MFSKIVVGVNGRDGGRDATALAKLLAAADTRLAFVHVRVSDLVPAWDHNADFDFDHAELASELIEREQQVWGGPAESRSIAAASVGEGLERIAADQTADLLVIGACERGALGRVLIGDDAASALHEANPAVAIAPRGYAARRHRINRIGVAFDGSIESQAARSLAASLARDLRAELVARCVVAPHVFATGIGAGASYMEDPEDVLARTRATLGEYAESTEIVIGATETGLAEFSDEVGLLICGTRHNAILRRAALGSTSGYLAHHARCPLLVAGVPVEAATAGRAPATVA